MRINFSAFPLKPRMSLLRTFYQPYLVVRVGSIKQAAVQGFGKLFCHAKGFFGSVLAAQKYMVGAVPQVYVIDIRVYLSPKATCAFAYLQLAERRDIIYFRQRFLSPRQP